MQHFELHFQAEYIIHYQDSSEKWKKTTFEELSIKRDIKRIQYNTRKYQNYIILDIDNDDIYAYKKANLPNPNFIVKNRYKQGAHLFYVLDRTVASEYYKEKWSHIQKSFSVLAKADEKNRGFIAKNLTFFIINLLLQSICILIKY